MKAECLIRFLKEENKMTLTICSKPIDATSEELLVTPKRSVAQFLTPLNDLAKKSPSLLARHFGEISSGNEVWEIPRFLYIGAQGGDNPIRLGIFASINGDEPEGAYALAELIKTLEIAPELARGYCLFIYPICNPSGFEDGTRLSRNGHDLNQQFWKDPEAQEVVLLQRELYAHAFHGLITLKSDAKSSGMYGFVRGATLSRSLLEPALKAAEVVLPRNRASHIGQFKASHGIVRNRKAGILSDPGKLRPRPFEIILETPRAAPRYQQENALLVSVITILGEYRKMIAYAANI
jgi:protein MpaA